MKGGRHFIELTLFLAWLIATATAWKRYDDSLLTFQDIVNKLLENISRYRDIFIVKRPDETAFVTDNINSDAMNIVCVDAYHNLLKLVRIGGANIDKYMRPRKAICIDYSTGKICGEIK